MKNVYLFIILGTLFVSCNGKSNERRNNELIEVIDLVSSSQKKISELFSSFEIIQLETDTSSLVGLSLGRMEIYKDKIFLLNQLSSRRNILCFNSNGNFLFAIDRFGEGSEEYTYLQDFFIDKNQDELVLICSPYGAVMYLDMEGNFVKTKARPDKSYISHMYPLNDSTYMGYSDMVSQPIGFNLMQFDANSFEIKQMSDMVKEEIPNMGHLRLAYYNNSIYFYDFLGDTIYDVTDLNLIKTLYYINSGKDTQDAKKQIKAISSKKNEIYIMESLKIYYDMGMISIHSYFINNNWVAINIDEPRERYKMKEDIFESIVFYNKKKQESYSSKNIIFDVFNLNEALPEIQIIGNSDDFLYILINIEFTEKQKEQIKQSKLTEKEKAILINHTEEDNPIIMKIKT